MSITCPKCQSPIPSGFSFCGICGTPYTAESGPPSSLPPSGPPPSGPPSHRPLESRVKIVVLRGPVPEGTVFDLKPGLNTLGREADIAFANDATIDPVHLSIEVSGSSAALASADGYTGVFFRLKTPTQIETGDVIFAGEQYLVVRHGDSLEGPVVSGSSDEPKEVFGTPLPAPRLHLTQLLAGGVPGRVASTDKTVMSVGRENCDLSFPQDRFMSGRHLRVEANGERLTVTDVGSLNGTFTKANHLPMSLRSGDELMVGSILFRVDVA